MKYILYKIWLVCTIRKWNRATLLWIKINSNTENTNFFRNRHISWIFKIETLPNNHISTSYFDSQQFNGMLHISYFIFGLLACQWKSARPLKNMVFSFSQNVIFRTGENYPIWTLHILLLHIHFIWYRNHYFIAIGSKRKRSDAPFLRALE